jgi:hypothetical protein
MSYRPITDIWFLARAKLKGGEKYYGAYLGGFPERARVLLGASIDDPVLHVCGGKARLYPYKGGFGPNDKTLDLDEALQPDFWQDASARGYPQGFRAMLADPPYSAVDAAHYAPGSNAYPAPNKIVENMINALPVGSRAGIIHYILPKGPANTKFLACVGIVCGFNNRMRCFSVFEKVS